MARLALSKLGLSGNLLKTSIDWPRLDKAGPGWTRPAWAGQGQWKSPFRVVDWPGPASAWPGQRYFQIFTGLGWPGPAQASHVLSGPAQASPARPLFCTGRQVASCTSIMACFYSNSFFGKRFHRCIQNKAVSQN